MAQDFSGQLGKQLRFLQASCSSYDAGDRDEAIRIALSLRVLFHTKGRNISLVDHLGLANLNLMSSLGPERRGSDPNLYYAASIVTQSSSLRVDLGFGVKGQIRPLGINPEQMRQIMAASTEAKCEYLPTLDVKKLQPVPFAGWWAEEVVVAAGGFRFSRRDLALVAADKDGGAHVDADLPQGYEHLLSATPIRVTAKLGRGSKIPRQFQDLEVQPRDLHHATLRQIAFEVLSSPLLIKASRKQ